jgi:hypothetical protein
MKNIALAVQILSALAGMYAAYCWWVASTGKIHPGWTVEPGEAEAAQAGWIVGIMNNVIESAKLNKRAALWTGASVLLSSVSGILSLI